MNADVIVNERCLLCESHLLRHVLSLTPTPLANALESVPDGPATPTYPLDLYLCGSCAHLQLGVTVDPELLFRAYTYVSPSGMDEHWRQHAAHVIPRVGLKPHDLVVEIGSNSGALLTWYRDAGMRVCGFEPAVRIAASAPVPTLPTFFSRATAKEAPGPAKLVLANNVFAHIRDLADVMAGVDALLAPGGVFIAEVQYRGDMLDGGYWDTCYHEHQHYHTVAPLVRFFDSAGFQLFDVQRVATHGGSIRVFVQRRGGGHPETRAVSEYIAAEAGPPTWAERLDAFTSRIETARADFRAAFGLFTDGIRNGGGAPRVAVLGCPAKLTTLAYHIGLRPHDVDYVCDDAPTKLGKLTPGLRWPIVPFDRLLTDPPHLAVVGAWNYAESLIARVRTMFAEVGRPAPRFLVPFPTPQVIT